MSDDRSLKLGAVLEELTSRYGNRIIQSGQTRETARLTTGIEELDRNTGGGLCPARLTLVVGQQTSGATSVALQAIAATQRGGGHVVYIDRAGQFDPANAATCGIDPTVLLLVRPDDTAKTLSILRDLLANGSSSLIVLDVAYTPFKIESSDVRRLQQALAASSAALLMVCDTVPSGLERLAGTHIRMKTLAWHRRGNNILGIHSSATINDGRGDERITLLILNYGLGA